MISFTIKLNIKKFILLLATVIGITSITLYIAFIHVIPEAGHETMVPQRNPEKGDTILVLISDYRSYSPTQVIQIAGSSMKYGFATVVYPFDHITGKDIIWEPNFEMDAVRYPIIERELNISERKEIEIIINELNNGNFVDSRSYTDDYQYIVYYKGKKIASAYARSFGSGALSSVFTEILTQLLSLASPFYPNYGFQMIE